MEHIFYIHSPITEKMAVSISKSKGIEDPLFVNQERYIPKSVSSKCIKEIYKFEKTRYNIFKRWYEIKEGDREIGDMTSEKFHLYVPQTSIKEVRILISHKRCEGFSIMEEGLMSYLEKERVEKRIEDVKESKKKKIKYMGRLGKYEFHKKGYKKMYGMSDMSFPGYENVSKVEVEFGINGDSERIREEECVLVLDSIKSYSKRLSCGYIYSIDKVVRKLSEKYERVNFKMHPDSYGNWREDIFRTIIHRGASSAREIDRSRCLEDIAIESGADVIVNLSSTGLYCGLFSDGNVYSFYDLFASSISSGKREENDEISDELDWVPEIYWKYVQPIGLTL